MQALRAIKVVERVGESAKNLPAIRENEFEGAVVIPIKTGVEARLERLGMKAATRKIDMAHKLTIAYAQYLFVKYEAINEFNKLLREETLKEDKNAYQYKQLDFIPLENYSEVPPEHVLDALDRAQEDGCFDSFTIAKIVDKVEVKDPILFGRITGCTDYFFIAQWDDDIRFEDLLSMNTTRAKGSDVV